MDKTVNAIKTEFTIEIRNPKIVFANIATALTLSGVAAYFAQLLSNDGAGIIFVFLLFIAVISPLAHIFIRDRERRNHLFSQLYRDPLSVFFGKVIFNGIFAAVAGVLCAGIFLFLYTPDLPLLKVILFSEVISISFALTTSCCGSIVKNADSRHSLFLLISIPLTAPVLFAAADAGRTLFLNKSISSGALIFILAFSFLQVVIGAILTGRIER